MSDLEFESYNVTIPLQNTEGMKCIACIVINQGGTAINLSDYFGGLGNGHYFTLQADGQKIYVAAAAHAGTGINPMTTGNGGAVCWPIPDGQQMPVRLLGGREVGTGYASLVAAGYATLTNYSSGVILHAKISSFIASGASPTGYLRIYRSSVGETQGTEQFKPVGF